MSEWISVNIELPKNEVVLVYCGVEVGIGGYSAHYGWWVTGIDDEEESDVTHWMPLPEAPK